MHTIRVATIGNELPAHASPPRHVPKLLLCAITKQAALHDQSLLNPLQSALTPDANAHLPFMAGWVPSTVLADPDLFERLPAALDAWVQFGGGANWERRIGQSK